MPAGRALPAQPSCRHRAAAAAAAAAAGSIVVDGLLNDACWQGAAWTSEFVDIVGPQWGRPWFSTRVKMLWDESALYVAAALEEPRAFANQTLHDRWGLRPLQCLVSVQLSAV
jgi:hypothetical protein